MAKRALVLTAVLAITGMGAQALAMPIYYGDFVGQNVTFQNVHEDSATDTPPLYQVAGSMPILETLTIDGYQHDRLIFSPAAAFRASAHGGQYDETDGLLRFALKLHPDIVLMSMNLAEGGDWSTDGDNTFVRASAAIIAAQGTDVLGTTADINYADNIWTGHATLDLSQFTDEGIILITIDNVLEAYADVYDMNGVYPTARIAKKAFMIEIITIPEPGTLLLLIGGAMLGLRRAGRSASARVPGIETGHIE